MSIIILEKMDFSDDLLSVFLLRTRSGADGLMQAVSGDQFSGHSIDILGVSEAGAYKSHNTTGRSFFNWGILRGDEAFFIPAGEHRAPGGFMDLALFQ
jgi:hypothetical protein